MGARSLGRHSLKIGVGVEGPSDRAFLAALLNREFWGVQFDIRVMKGRTKLVRRAAELADSFRSLRYPFSIILVDRDSDPCITATIESFDHEIVTAARAPIAQRDVFVCVAVAELESWYLADEQAIQHAIPGASYRAPPETGVIGADRTLSRLRRETAGDGPVRGGKRALARAVAQHFDPERARRHSASFAYFWDRITAAIQAAS